MQAFGGAVRVLWVDRGMDGILIVRRAQQARSPDLWENRDFTGGGKYSGGYEPAVRWMGRLFLKVSPHC